MSRTSIYALALGAIVFSATLAEARGGGGGGSGGGMKGPSASGGQQSASNKVNFKPMKVMNCGKYGRSNGNGGVTMVTVCN